MSSKSFSISSRPRHNGDHIHFGRHTLVYSILCPQTNRSITAFRWALYRSKSLAQMTHCSSNTKWHHSGRERVCACLCVCVHLRSTDLLWRPSSYVPHLHRGRPDLNGCSAATWLLRLRWNLLLCFWVLALKSSNVFSCFSFFVFNSLSEGL